jgi:cobalt/nickel transport system permease protein
MEIEKFALGDTWIHRLDPRAKILAASIFSVAVALNFSVMAAAAAVFFPLILLLSARLSLKRVLARLAVVNGFVFFLWFFIPFSFPGETIYSLGPLNLRWEGVVYAILITLKTNAIVLTTIVLLGTSPVFALVHAMSHMGAPDKLVHIFFFCFRYIHVIHEEYHRLVNAMRIRGFKPRTDMHTYRAYAYLIGMLLVRSFDRSLRILAAMRCRGFKSKFYILHDYQMKKPDYLIAASSLLLFATLVFVR